MEGNDKSPWKTISSKTVYDNPWITVKHEDVINPSGGEGIYGTIHFKNYAIGILPIDHEGYTWLVGQYRYPLKQYSWEIPEGGGSLHETTLASAQRELLEETGLKASKWTTLIEEVHISNSVTDEKGVIYLAQELTQHEAEPEDTEDLTIKKVHITEAIAMVASNQITDSLATMALLKVETLLLKGVLSFSCN